jgi:hypothetical protein
MTKALLSPLRGRSRGHFRLFIKKNIQFAFKNGQEF